MAKNVTVKDAFGNVYEATWPKRAKGLVKAGRARFVDDHTICLVCPPEEFYSEDFFMDKNIQREEMLREAATLAKKAEDLLRQADKLSDHADALSDSAEAMEDAAEALRDRAEELAEEAGDGDGSAEELEEEAEAKEKEASRCKEEAGKQRSVADQLREQAKYLAEQGRRLGEKAQQLCTQTMDSVKVFVDSHQEEIDAVQSAVKKALDTAVTYTGKALKFTGEKAKEYGTRAVEETKKAMEILKQRFGEAKAEEPEEEPEEEECCCRNGGAPRHGGPRHGGFRGHHPRRGAGHLFMEMQRIAEGGSRLQALLREVKENPDMPAETVAAMERMVTEREKTNRDLLAAYEKIYQEEKEYPFWYANRKVEELESLREKFKGVVSDEFLDELTEKKLREIYLPDDDE